MAQILESIKPQNWKITLQALSFRLKLRLLCRRRGHTVILGGLRQI